MFSLKMDQPLCQVQGSPLQAQAIMRCPDILAFHASLNRFFRARYDFAGEAHPFYELVYVVEGRVGITAGQEYFYLRTGQMLLHPPNEFHRICAADESEPHVLNISFYAASVPYAEGRVFEPTSEEGAELQRISEALRRALKNADRRLLHEQRMRLELWLHEVMGRGSSSVPPSASESALLYTNIVDFLRQHIGEPLSAQEIAAQTYVSHSMLKKIFHQYAGMGVIRYFTEMKMRHAVLLLQSGRRVGETAAALGYTDQNYFSTVFHRVMGVSPGSLRSGGEEVGNEKKNTFNEKGNGMKFITVESYQKLSRQAANIISAQVIMKPNSVLGLATGSSPVGVYNQLAEWYRKGDIDFSETVTVNLDEYLGLSEEDPQSYRYFMQKNFFDNINIRRENTFVPNGCASDPAQECMEYDARIARMGGIDLQLLGIGLDGHIGFNEPSDVFVKDTHVVDLHESTIKANSRFFESEADVPRQAITMGMVSIMQAKKILLVANGKAKKEILEKAFFGAITPQIPASILQLHPDITVVYSEE